MIVEVSIEDLRWDALSLEALAQDVAPRVLAHLNIADEDVEVSVLACDDARIATLNATFRDKTSATNVLSWPAQDLAAEYDGTPPDLPEPDFDGTLELGDIAISYDTCVAEAKALARPMRDHVTHLIVHGMLHLLGYDHIRDQDATLMEGIEVALLGTMGIDDPYKMVSAE